MSVSRVLIYGGRGALGGACVTHFKEQQFWVGCIDMKENEEADANIIVNPNIDWQQQNDFSHTVIGSMPYYSSKLCRVYEVTGTNRTSTFCLSELGKHESVLQNVASVLGEDKVDAVICVAGGWAGGNAGSEDFIKNTELMWKQSVWSSSIAACIASKHLKDNGLITLPGAHAAKEGTPGMIGYGLAKAAVHQLTKSLALDKSGLPTGSTALALLPITLDTPMNRKWMPKADTSTWTPISFIAESLCKWAKGEERPKSGSLVSLVTQNNVTKLEIA